MHILPSRMILPPHPNRCFTLTHTRRSHLAVFVMQRDGQARLDFIQNMSYKFVELLSCNFARSPDELVRQQITYRYNALKVRAKAVRAGGGGAGGTRERARRR